MIFRRLAERALQPLGEVVLLVADAADSLCASAADLAHLGDDDEPDTPTP